jgi:hypothetical protein
MASTFSGLLTWYNRVVTDSYETIAASRLEHAEHLAALRRVAGGLDGVGAVKLHLALRIQASRAVMCAGEVDLVL